MEECTREVDHPVKRKKWGCMPKYCRTKRPYRIEGDLLDCMLLGDVAGLG